MEVGRRFVSAFQVQLLCNTTLFCAAPSLASSSGKHFVGSGAGREEERDGRETSPPACAAASNSAVTPWEP